MNHSCQSIAESLVLSCMTEKKTSPEVWETDALFRCPLVGICLTREEQRHLLEKVEGHASTSPFEAHERLVGATATDTPLSRRMGRIVRRKYEREASELRELTESSFLARWKKAFAEGRYAAFIWAAATGNFADVTRRSIYGDIHMTMHGMADEHNRVQQRVLELERKNRQQSERLRALKESASQTTQELQRTKEIRASLERECLALRQERDELRATTTDAEWVYWQEQGPKLEEENLLLQLELSELKQQVEEQAACVRKLVAQVRSSVRPCLEPLSEKTSCPDHCDPTCPAFDVCRKRVLIVGGIERMEARYREFIEGAGGTLDYHDGSLQGGVRQLERYLLRADVIICPVNCNSHGACIKVKKLAKKHQKTFYMLPNASLTTLSKLFNGTTTPEDHTNPRGIMG